MNRVYLSVFDYGAIDLAINHISSLIKAGMDNYIAYVTDKESYEKLTQLEFNVYLMSSDGAIPIKGKDFGTNDFNKLSFVRYKAIEELLSYGNEVWYMDVDTVVLQNLNVFNIDPLPDIVFQNDLNMLCTGCMLIRPTAKAMSLIRLLYNKLLTQSYTNNDQIELNKLLNATKPIQYGVLSHNAFPNGVLYFDVDVPESLKPVRQEFEQSKENVLFVHANWMIGIDKKIAALKSKNLWFTL
jgi:hypothetical protein